MSNRFESTKLWQSTLAPQLSADPDHDLRRQLRTAFELFRERAALLARQIERDLPDFTVHDITHIDALWEMAETITDGKYELTPSEAFVLGGAFLVHDLGMSVAAIPGGVAAIQQEQVYRDTIASHLKKQLGRVPSQEEQTNAAAEVRQIATGHTLRTLHAKYAEQLALATWTDDHGRESHLIEDPELRQTYGRLIGIIAHSHWWPIDKVLTKMPARTGAPGGYPSSWTVDPIKLACLLRVADAAHLDSRRAPAFVRALRRPTGDAIPHWDFQEKLYQPRLEAGRLVYTCKERFPEAQAPAWWACYDALRVVDRELRDVDAALAAADGKLPRLAATGVANTEEPWRLTQLIEVDGWQPVDTQLRVTAVGALVKTLGGEALYGNDSTAPLRELIQNASDAVRARRVIEKESPQWGSVIVRTGADELGEWLEVEDTGIGMSPTVLCGPLLDFGNSFWGSKLMHDELPGLEAAGFSSTGRFGIGFFAVFMLGDHVTVTSRRYEAGHDETWVLDFKQGVEDRPLLRKARANEVIEILSAHF